jgi:hypothetical protein
MTRIIVDHNPDHKRPTGADLRTALEGTSPPDDAFARDISAALGLVISEVSDPETGRLLLTRDAKARFSDLPDITAIDA